MLCYGPEGTRTPDFHNAIVALSQLSYRPQRDDMLAPKFAPVNRGSVENRGWGAGVGRQTRRKVQRRA